MRSSYVIAAVVAVGVAAWIASGNMGGATVDPKETAVEPVVEETITLPVRVRRVHAELMKRDLVLLGRTTASRMVKVRAETAGRVDAVQVAKGSRVKAGDTLLRLALEERPDRLAEARSLVEQRRLEFEAAEKLLQKNFRSRTDVAAAEAALKSAQANLAAIRTDLGHTVIAAPFDGILEDRTAEIGDFVDKGEPVATVVDLNPVKIAIDIPEREINKVATDGSAQAHLVDGSMVTGTVVYVSSSANPTTRTFRVEVELANPDGSLREGTTARVILPVGEEMAHRISPAVLTLSDDGAVGVKVVDGQDRVRFYPVQMVADTENGMWLGGLPDPVDVIVVGQEFVRAGQTVQAVPEQMAEQAQ